MNMIIFTDKSLRDDIAAEKKIKLDITGAGKICNILKIKGIIFLHI